MKSRSALCRRVLLSVVAACRSLRRAMPRPPATPARPATPAAAGSAGQPARPARRGAAGAGDAAQAGAGAAAGRRRTRQRRGREEGRVRADDQDDGGARRPADPAGSPRRDPAQRARSAGRLHAAVAGEQDARHQGRATPRSRPRWRQLAAQFPDEEAFEKALKDRGMTADGLRKDARSGPQRHQADGRRSRDACRARATPKRRTSTRRTRTSSRKRNRCARATSSSASIRQADAAAKKKAKARSTRSSKKAKAGDDFAKLAQEHSQDGSAAQGGDLELLPARDRWSPSSTRWRSS